MRDGDAGDGGPPEVIIGDQEGARYRGQHPDLVTGVREVRQDGRLDLADDLERARAHDGHARTRTGLQVPAPRHRPRDAIYRARSMSLPLTRPGALLIVARRPDPGNGRLIAAVSVGDPAAAQRAGERLERCDGLIFVITIPSTFRAMLRGSRERRAWLDSLPERVDQQ